VSHSDEEIEAAVEALNEAGRLAEAEAVVERAAPGLQRILAGALASGGWFAESHEAELRKLAEIDDPLERTTALRTLLAEETRMGMMIGVAVGWALREELNREA
jgi:hypothetical protein